MPRSSASDSAREPFGPALGVLVALLGAREIVVADAELEVLGAVRQQRDRLVVEELERLRVRRAVAGRARERRLPSRIRHPIDERMDRVQMLRTLRDDRPGVTLDDRLVPADAEVRA